MANKKIQKPAGKKPQKATGKKAAPVRETLKLTIDSLDNEGIGQASHEGKTALVQGAFPGETVVAEVEHSGRTHIFTRLRRLLRQSQARSARQLCAQEQQCLGCPLIAMKYADQLRYKQQLVSDALKQNGLEQAIEVADVIPSEPAAGYRASAKLVFSRRREKVIIGLYRRGSHEVVDCGDCPVHHPLINRIAAVVRDEVQRQQISVYNPTHQRGCLRYLLIRVSPVSGKAMVTFVSNYRDLQQLPKLAKWLQRRIPEVVSVHENVNSSTGNVILGQESLKLLGHPDLLEQIGDIKLKIAPGAFFQVNTVQATAIYQLVRSWAALSRRDTAIDLFCGIGGIALHLAQDAGQLFGIEYVPEAVQSATENAYLNQLHHCRFVAGDAGEELHKLPLEGKKPRLISLNPPRKGCDEALLKTIGEMAPEQIIYVSCSPESLARDLRILTGYGYRIDKLQPFDMFPQTAHVETLVKLVL